MSDVESSFCPIKFIGQGRFGAVFSAKRKNDGQIYAIKQIKIDNNNDNEDYLREARINDQLSQKSCNIVQSYWSWKSPRDITEFIGLWEWDFLTEEQPDEISSHGVEFFYLVMELCPRNLKEMMMSLDSQSLVTSQRHWLWVVSVMDGITCAIVEMHRQGFMHLDLKLENILFSEDNIPKLCDFGSARYSALYDRIGPIFDVGPFTGPEILGKNYYNHKLDIFALGKIFQWMMNPHGSGEELFQSGTPRMQALYQKMVGDNPEHRPEATEVRKELRIISEEIKKTCFSKMLSS